MSIKLKVSLSGNKKINTAEGTGSFLKYLIALGIFGPVLITSCAFLPGSFEARLFSNDIMNSGLLCFIVTTCCCLINLIFGSILLINI